MKKIHKMELEALLKRKKEECSNLSISLSIAGEELDEIETLLNGALNVENAKKYRVGTTSNSLYSFLSVYLCDELL